MTWTLPLVGSSTLTVANEATMHGVKDGMEEKSEGCDALSCKQAFAET